MHHKKIQEHTSAMGPERWLERGGYTWEDFLEEVHFKEEAKFPGPAEADRRRWRGAGKERGALRTPTLGKQDALRGAGAN